MSQAIEIKVPDIGDYDAVPVIEVHVKPGDSINAEDALVTLESDKATMDVPSPQAGVVKDVRIKVGDNVSEGSVLVMLEAANEASAAPPAAAAADVLCAGRRRRLDDEVVCCRSRFAVTRGLDPGVHHKTKKMDRRVKPGDDGRIAYLNALLSWLTRLVCSQEKPPSFSGARPKWP